MKAQINENIAGYLIIWMFYFGAFLSGLIIYVAMEFI